MPVPSVAAMHSLPFELFSIIANHLPLPNRPPLLLSLGLTSRYIWDIIVPCMLYEHLIIHNEESLVSVVDTLSCNPRLKSAVRGIYIRAFLSRAENGTAFPALLKLKNLFDLGGLSGVQAIHLRLGLYKDGKPQAFGSSNPFESLSENFWLSLNNCSPGLQTPNLGHHGQLYPISTYADLFPWHRHTHLAHFKVRS
jgi:hypothetical protein